MLGHISPLLFFSFCKKLFGYDFWSIKNTSFTIFPQKNHNATNLEKTQLKYELLTVKKM